MSFLGVEDTGFIKYIMMHDSVFDWICDDGTDDKQTFSRAIESIVGAPGYYFYSPGPGCVFMLNKIFTGLYEVHTCIIKGYRGYKSIGYGKSLLDACFNQIGMHKLISHIPSYNKAAFRYAIKCGMTKEGVLKEAWLKRGKLYDVTIVQLTKKEFSYASSSSSSRGRGCRGNNVQSGAEERSKESGKSIDTEH